MGGAWAAYLSCACVIGLGDNFYPHGVSSCNDVLFKPGFNLASISRVDVGRLGDKTCCHCNALLYEGEAPLQLVAR